MVCNLNEGFQLSCFTAYSIILANDHNIPVRVPNTLLADIQFHAGQKMARFWPIIESISPTSPMKNTCVGVLNQCHIQSHTLVHLPSALSPSFSAAERTQVLDTLLLFPDVFTDELGYTYHYRSEVKQQVADMLGKGIIQSTTSSWTSLLVLV